MHLVSFNTAERATMTYVEFDFNEVQSDQINALFEKEVANAQVVPKISGYKEETEHSKASGLSSKIASVVSWQISLVAKFTLHNSLQ